MRFHAIPAAELAALREVPAPVEVDGSGGTPLRCCLRLSEPGESIMLVSYAPPGGLGAYAEVGPVFIHPAPCGGHPGAGYPEALRNEQRVFRAYNRAGRIAHAEIAEPVDAEKVLTRLFDDSEVTLVQARALHHGCFTFAVTR